MEDYIEIIKQKAVLCTGNKEDRLFSCGTMEEPT